MKPIKLTCGLLGAAGMISELVPDKYSFYDTIPKVIKNQLHASKKNSTAVLGNGTLTVIRGQRVTFEHLGNSLM